MLAVVTITATGITLHIDRIAIIDIALTDRMATYTVADPIITTTIITIAPM